MIVDSHMHVHQDTEGLGDNKDASVETFLQNLDASPLDLAVLLPIEPVIPNEFVFDVAKQRPNRIVCYGSANPADGPVAVELFERLAAEHPIVGLKLHPRRQGITRTHWPVAIRLVQVAARHDLPILVDAFPYGKGALHDESLELVEALSSAVPKARLIIAHMGGHRILDALILARTSYSIYLDLSLIYSVYRGSHIEQDIFYAIRRLGAKRCIYGSDYPDCGMTTYYHEMRETLDQNGFSPEDQDWIFGKTAQKVLRLEKGVSG